MSTVPRALRRARLWTAGLMTASTVLVGAIGIHLAEAQTRTIATQTSFGTSASSSSGSSSSDDSSSTTSSSDAGASDLGSSSSSSGFGAVAPVGGSNAQAQTNSGGS
ncbi:hypothetical protein [Terrabacter sp. 2YAF2]|uniref:hypothetical protein n=1 Tax=Terrabacter sp. 2YAF2 TaxID=3233026 RepID=UPI003F9C0EB1